MKTISPTQKTKTKKSPSPTNPTTNPSTNTQKTKTKKSQITQASEKKDNKMSINLNPEKIDTPYRVIL